MAARQVLATVERTQHFLMLRAKYGPRPPVGRAETRWPGDVRTVGQPRPVAPYARAPESGDQLTFRWD